MQQSSKPAHPPPTAANLLLPWAAFLALLAWAWRVTDLFHTVPAYGDGLEILWGLQWYAHSLAHGVNPLFYPAVFAPQGWQVATLAHGPVLFLALMPLYALGGAAFASNVAALTAHVLAFGGMFKMARHWLRPMFATGVALAFTFWSFRWFRNGAHLHTLLATAMLPFEVWAWERARRRPAQRRQWLVITGLFWSIAITASLYALWHGLVLLVVWGLAQCLGRQMDLKRFITGLLLAGSTALVFSSPTLWLFWRAISTSLTPLNSIDGLVFFSASLNSFPIPSLMHPWLASFAVLLDRALFMEADLANFGLAGFLAALAGIILFRRDRRLWPLLGCMLVGLVLALGPALKVNGVVVPADWLAPVDSALWSFGHQVKPGLFPQAQPPTGLANFIPLPALLLAISVPFWEGARVWSRFAFVAAIGLFPLAGLALQRLKPVWLRAALALVLLFEVLPPPTGSVPAQPATHPAFAWLQSQDLAGAGIIDLEAGGPDRLRPIVGGDIIFATLYHHQTTAAGVGSYTPAHFIFLQQWFENTPHPLQNPDLAFVMGSYRVRYLLVHMGSRYAQALVDEARANAALRLVQCFDPPPGVSPWAIRMCVVEVLPAPGARYNVMRRDGWSADEPWGTWLNGQQATAAWVATSTAAETLKIALLPVCLPSQPQHVTVTVNGVAIGDHAWTNCDPWSDSLAVPAGVAQVGWNILTIQADVAGQPVDPATGRTIDTRRLSVAVMQLVTELPGASQ